MQLQTKRMGIGDFLRIYLLKNNWEIKILTFSRLCVTLFIKVLLKNVLTYPNLFQVIR